MNVLLRPIDSIEMMLPIEIIVYVCSLDIVQRRFFFLFILTYISIIIIIYYYHYDDFLSYFLRTVIIETFYKFLSASNRAAISP